MPESFKICPRSAPGWHRVFQKTEAVLTLSQRINVDEEDDLRNYKSDCLMLILWGKKIMEELIRDLINNNLRRITNYNQHELMENRSY